ncbi:hypothetical protein MMC08_009140 [Hypocenomyce scalaris]|nr:hypothetical protein [Hypocenomyce scalaris]
MLDSRIFPRISLQDFERRKAEITTQLVDAATGVGFFVIVDHDIAIDQIDHMFEGGELLFALPDDIKAQNAFSREKNVGWEKQAQIRPSTGTPDLKESIQLQFSQTSMCGKWPSDSDAPGFQADALAFMRQCQTVSIMIMSCFAQALFLPSDFFTRAHDVSSDKSQCSEWRHPTPPKGPGGVGWWVATCR